MKSRPDDLAQETIRKVANDENMAAIRGNTRVADIYFGEFMRVFDHLYSRYIVEKMKNAGKSDPDAGYLKDDAKDWVPANFSKGRKDLRRLNRLKTEYSEDDLPLDPDFATQLLHWKRQCPPSSGEWVFANPATSLPNYASEIQKDYLKPAGRRIGLEANGLPVNLGWHTFRHTYRSLLDATGAPIGVQQKLMRHAQVSTTMDVYGNALMDSKREANSRVLSLLLRTPKEPEPLRQ